MEPQQPGPPQGGWPPPPGAAPYPPPPGSAPYPPPPGWYAPQVDQGRNGMSIAGLVLGIVPIMGGILGVVFGLIGRSQAKRRGQKGRVMGTWGAALGAAWIVLFVVIISLGIADDAKRDDKGKVVEPGQASSFTLRVGDCLRTVPRDAAEVDQVDLVACTTTHKGEVYAATTFSDASYPGDKATSTRAERSCVTAFEPFVGKAYDESSLDVFYLYPSPRSWRQDDRKITCIVSGTNLVGTLKGSKR